MSPRALVAALRAYWRPETGIFIALWFFLMLVGRTQLFQDPGTFWHTVVGERMLTSGQLIYTDPFTFTWHGRHWIAHQWLGECLMALVHRLDGFDSLLLFTATVLTALYTWIAHRLIRTGLHWTVTAVLLVFIVAASSAHFHVRPHIGTIVFLGVTMGFLVDFEAGRIELARMFWLVPIFLVWSSIHGGALGGLATLALALAGWTAYRLIRRDSPIQDTRRFLGCGVLFAACVLTIVVNPYGLWLPRTWIGIMESETLTRIIVEHSPLDPFKLDGALTLFLAAVYLVALFSTWPRSPRVTWLLPFAWFLLANQRVRHAPLFAVTAALALADLLPYSRTTQWLARSGSDLFQPPIESAATKARDWRPALVPVLLIVTAVLLQLARVPMPVLGHGWARLDPTYWPIDLVGELRQHQYTRPGGTPIFNEYIYGGFLIYHAPGYRVFVDDRCELYRDPADEYRDQWLDQFVQAELEGTATAIRAWEQRYGRFDFALVKTRTGGEPGFDDYFGSAAEWTVVRRTPTATFYQRKK